MRYSLICLNVYRHSVVTNLSNFYLGLHQFCQHTIIKLWVLIFLNVLNYYIEQQIFEIRKIFRIVMFIGSQNGGGRFRRAMSLPLLLVNARNKYCNRAVNHSISAANFDLIPVTENNNLI